MEDARIRRIRGYVTGLEEGLFERDYRGLTTLGHLRELYRIIEKLIQATFEAKDK